MLMSDKMHADHDSWVKTAGGTDALPGGGRQVCLGKRLSAFCTFCIPTRSLVTNVNNGLEMPAP